MTTINAVEFIGNIVAAPSTHKTNGRSVTYGRLAVTLLDSARQQSGTLWLTLIGRDQVGSRLAALGKGDRLWVTGSMDLPALYAGSDGATRVSVRVIVSALEFMPKAIAPPVEAKIALLDGLVNTPDATRIDPAREVVPDDEDVAMAEPAVEPTPAAPKVRRRRRAKAT
jgi:single-stranded DNA-binding protein